MTGVSIPRGQGVDTEESRGKPLSVGHAQLAFMVPVQYFDKLGKPYTEFVFVVDNVVYKDPEGQTWAGRLKTIAEPIASEIVGRTNDMLDRRIRSVLTDMGLLGDRAAPPDEVDVLSDATDRELG